MMESGKRKSDIYKKSKTVINLEGSSKEVNNSVELYLNTPIYYMRRFTPINERGSRFLSDKMGGPGPRLA